MDLDLEEILSSRTYNSRRNHIIASCPFCGKDGHFYFNVEKYDKKKDGKYRNCWDCKKCNEAGNIVKLLRKLNKQNLLEGEYLAGRDFIESPFLNSKSGTLEDYNILAKEYPLPIGFRRVNDNEYLRSRGFTDQDFQREYVGITNISVRLRDYIIIAIREQGKVRGYIARSTLSKKEINDINKLYKIQGLKKKYPRYRNSTGAEFSKLLAGYEEIMFNTSWVILVEGYFDKKSVDRALKLSTVQEMKCCCTFGKDISQDQILKLKGKGIENIILIQDPDAINHSKDLSDRLKKDFKRVLVGYTGDKDLGDSSEDEVLEIFDNLKNPVNFRLNIVQKLL